MFYVYILYSSKIDSFYVGSTANLQDRLKRHNEGRSKATKKGMPWIVVYTKIYNTRPEAYRAELYIKAQKSKLFILQLIENNQFNL